MPQHDPLEALRGARGIGASPNPIDLLERRLTNALLEISKNLFKRREREDEGERREGDPLEALRGAEGISAAPGSVAPLMGGEAPGLPSMGDIFPHGGGFGPMPDISAIAGATFGPPADALAGEGRRLGGGIQGLLEAFQGRPPGPMGGSDIFLPGPEEGPQEARGDIFLDAGRPEEPSLPEPPGFAGLPERSPEDFLSDFEDSPQEPFDFGDRASARPQEPEAPQFQSLEEELEEAPGGIWRSLLTGMIDSIAPALVAFAAQKAENPEIIRAWSEQQANQLREAQLEMQREAQQFAQVRDFQNMQLAELNFQRAQVAAQVGIMDKVRDLQRNEGVRDPITYLKGLAGYLPLFEASGGDPLLLIESNPIPNAQIIKEAEEEALKRIGLAGEGALNQTVQVGDENYTVQEILAAAGHVDFETNRFIFPFGAERPADRMTLRDVTPGGVEIETPVDPMQFREQQQIRHPFFAERVRFEVVPGEFTNTLYGLDSATGQLMFTREIPKGTADDPITPVSSALRMREVRQLFREVLGTNLSEEDVAEFLQRPDATERLQQLRQLRQVGGSQ